MARFLLWAAAILIGIWVFFAVLRALSAFIHLALVVAVIVIAYGLIMAIRRRATERE
jgi:hypothetical protein